MIRERDPNVVYKLVREKFINIYKRGALRKETPPTSFSYQTGWARGTITFTKGTGGTQITGTAQRQMSIIFTVILALVIGYYAYGLFGAFMLLGFGLLITLPFDAYFGGKKRRDLGPKLCKAVFGGKFQQE